MNVLEHTFRNLKVTSVAFSTKNVHKGIQSFQFQKSYEPSVSERLCLFYNKKW